ncbi:MAG: oxygen-insensitive NAD(P)H nitroreductase [Enterobacteriaceae bacterium]
MDIVTLAQKRYTTKNYDPNKKIPEQQFEQLCELLRLSPSSVNSQPWHFTVAHSDEAKARLLPAIIEFNHGRVINASHVLIFSVHQEIGDAHLKALLEQEERDHRFPSEQEKMAQDKGRRYFVGLNSENTLQQQAWQSRQLYLALGALLFGAASLGIDTTPIEGFDSSKMDTLLGLQERGLRSVVIASLGYRSTDDFNAQLPKSRLPREQIFTFL